MAKTTFVERRVKTLITASRRALFDTTHGVTHNLAGMTTLQSIYFSLTGIPVVVVYAGRNRITMATIGKIVNPRVVVGQNMVRWRCSRSVPTKKPFVERRVKTLIKASRLVNTDTTHGVTRNLRNFCSVFET